MLTFDPPSLVPGDHIVAADGHAEVHGRRLQGGAAGGEEAVLLPGGQTLHVLLPHQHLPQQGQPRGGYPVGTGLGMTNIYSDREGT